MAAIILLICLIILLYIFQKRIFRTSSTNHISLYTDCSGFWCPKEFRGDWGSILEQKSLDMRAKANIRLKEVFGIDNAFTTNDKKYYQHFLKTTIHRFGEIKKFRWSNMALRSSELIKQKLEKEQEKKYFLLSPFVQSITFRMVMLMFFPETLISSENLVEVLTSKINRLWIKSKSFETTHLHLLEGEKRALLDVLGRIMGKPVKEGRDNPLNIIIPAYETLWRVVLRIFLEVRFYSTKYQLERTRETAAKFLESPCLNSLNNNNSGHPSMACIVNEGLRLYPPTRRIHRKCGGAEIGIDIEAIQRDSKIWGPKARVYEPSRWMRPGISNLPNFLPFGKGFVCPAKNEIGPMMIGILVAALTTEIGDEYELSETQENYPLSGARDAFEAMRINLKEVNFEMPQKVN